MVRRTLVATLLYISLVHAITVHAPKQILVKYDAWAVQGWTPKPTENPLGTFQLFDVSKVRFPRRQVPIGSNHHICGYINGNSAWEWTCGAPIILVLATLQIPTLIAAQVRTRRVRSRIVAQTVPRPSTTTQRLKAFTTANGTLSSSGMVYRDRYYSMTSLDIL